jgi:hypothetical protein
MRKVYRSKALAALLTGVLGCLSQGASAQETNISNQNTNAFQLPGVTLPSGHDEVRASDGTTCRSAVSSGGAYVDIGVIGNPAGDGTRSAYGRIVVPLGRRGKRLDCAKLYALEVERLRTELRLLKMGVGGGIGGALDEDSEFSDAGWTQTGRN